MPLSPGSRVGDIRVELLLGQGGMSEVYLGIDERNQRQVALKVIQNRRLGALAKTRFLREAQILAQLDHPNICKVYDLISGPEADVMVLELVVGADLRSSIATGMSYEEKLQVAECIAEVLAVAHRHGIVHRDLKPENVMRTADGGVKVLDFDLARPTWEAEPILERCRAQKPRLPECGEEHVTQDSSEIDTDEMRTRMGSIVGTVPYMSPEQARGEPLTVASDLYTLGVLLHELFTGELPYRGDQPMRTLLFQVAEGATLAIQGVEPALADLIESLKRFDPTRRPPAEETARCLAELRQRTRR